MERMESPSIVLSDPLILPSHTLTPSAYRALAPSPQSSIVIDFGSHVIRAGYSSDPSEICPRLQNPPLVSRAREGYTSSRRRNYVGYDALQRSVRSSAKSAFEGVVASNPPLVERLLDDILVRLGLGECEKIEHGIVMTEPPCQLNSVRSNFMEILFEGYEVPRATFGIDGLFSYYYNSNRVAQDGSRRLARNDAMIINLGHNATHIIPVCEGRFFAPAAKRISIGGSDLTDAFTKRTRILNPLHASHLGTKRMGRVKEQVCYVSSSYNDELEQIRNDSKTFEQTVRAVKVPMAPSPDLSDSNSEDPRAKSDARKRQGRRLAEMMSKRRAEKAQNGGGSVASTDEESLSEAEVSQLYAARSNLYELQRLASMERLDEDTYFLSLMFNNLESREEMERNLEHAQRSFENSGGDTLHSRKATSALEAWEKKQMEDELVSITDKNLPAPVLKKIRNAKSIRTLAEARERSRREKAADRAKVEEKRAEEQRRREENPEAYVASLKDYRRQLAGKIKARETTKHSDRDRRSGSARRRMRLLAQHAGKEGAVDITSRKAGMDEFGTNDADWEVYRDMQVRKDDSEVDEDKEDTEALEKLRSEIMRLDPKDEDPTLIKPEGSALLYLPHGVVDEVPIIIDRIRVPEILFQPSIIGLEQCGLIEAMALSLNTFPSLSARESIVQELFLTGGVGKTRGFAERIRRDFRSSLPTEWGDSMSRGIRVAKDPSLDAWKGGALWAEKGGEAFENAGISKREYDEYGSHYVKEHFMGNKWIKTPKISAEEIEKRKEKKRRRM